VRHHLPPPPLRRSSRLIPWLVAHSRVGNDGGGVRFNAGNVRDAVRTSHVLLAPHQPPRTLLEGRDGRLRRFITHASRWGRHARTGIAKSVVACVGTIDDVEWRECTHALGDADARPALRTLGAQVATGLA